MTTTQKNTRTFELVEETTVTAEGKSTFWYTAEVKEYGSSIVNDSLCYKKDEAEKMFNLIIENNGIMRAKKVLKTTEIVVNEK